jgi:hypothetical protein
MRRFDTAPLLAREDGLSITTGMNDSKNTDLSRPDAVEDRIVV